MTAGRLAAYKRHSATSRVPAPVLSAFQCEACGFCSISSLFATAADLRLLDAPVVSPGKSFVLNHRQAAFVLGSLTADISMISLHLRRGGIRGVQMKFHSAADRGPLFATHAECHINLHFLKRRAVQMHCERLSRCAAPERLHIGPVSKHDARCRKHDARSLSQFADR